MTRGPAGVNDTWPEWRLEALRRLWGQGVSAKQIASALGGGLTRNAVVGKAHRMGLAGRPSPIIRDGRPRRPRKPQSAKAGRKQVDDARQRAEQAKAPTPIPPVIQLAPPPAPPPLREPRISSRTCAWPIGDPREPGFHFCGATPVREGRSYCDEHHAKAFQKRVPHAGAATPLFNAKHQKWAS
ncbi:GcrA family cell cycle regulator [Dongia deserti]|uniref:GcrA family cell cycle regulator n=1 Tax=Dongia deserti TaxID=2268030 RepID=UPI000E65D80D|nr:GcrA family cell cycle regulator [Dongia deserti]